MMDQEKRFMVAMKDAYAKAVDDNKYEGMQPYVVALTTILVVGEMLHVNYKLPKAVVLDMLTAVSRGAIDTLAAEIAADQQKGLDS